MSEQKNNSQDSSNKDEKILSVKEIIAALTMGLMIGIGTKNFTSALLVSFLDYI